MSNGPKCGHSACSQNYVDTGEAECVQSMNEALQNDLIYCARAVLRAWLADHNDNAATLYGPMTALAATLRRCPMIVKAPAGKR